MHTEARGAFEQGGQPILGYGAVVTGTPMVKSVGLVVALFAVVITFSSDPPLGSRQQRRAIDSDRAYSGLTVSGLRAPDAAASLLPTASVSPAIEAETSRRTKEDSGGSPAAQADGRSPITLAFAGDTSFHNSLHLLDPLASAQRTLSLPDFTVVNLETAIAPPTVGLPPVSKEFLFRSNPESVDALTEAGIDAVTMANNHALDYGAEALQYGLGALREAGVHTIGAGTGPEEAYEPLVVPVGDWSIGIAAFSRVPCDWSWAGENIRPQVAWACPAFLDKADAVVAQLVDEVDLAVVMVHGGTEGQLCPDAVMTGLNRRWASAGVGLVVNSHPHVVQGVTSIDETIVIQSTGNFAFPPSSGLTANSAVFFATLSEQGLLVSVEPFVSEGGVLSDGSSVRRASILSQIDQYSSGWRVLSDGRAVQDPSHDGLCGSNS